MNTKAETFSDKLLGFTVPDRSARGRMVRLDRVVDEVLAAHDYPAPVTHLLEEALVLTALMGGLLKADGEDAQLTMQAQTKVGAVSLLVCDYRAGALRGYADFDSERLSELGANPTLPALFGEGYLAITFETGAGQRYQGIVPLEGDGLAQACEAYFSQSEQIPTLIRVASRSGGKGGVAAGLLIQHLADGEEGRERLHVRMDHPDWEHVATMAGSISHDELLDKELSLETLVWRLFHEESEVRVQSGSELSRGCRCSAEYYASVLSRFPEGERDEMRNDSGIISVDCAFCAKTFELSV
ncbi:Hsp33 family molecular chaperone HslO [Erythrobacter sp. SCSIO 43205]|uniref:Hsp33 family molecular chaperone HslO n=1 Tax=Erythrobacter sp. SCSIO 43205 TaxID=2779361 RepID=UPI001CA9A0A1|nr:Hsp33 family molecular chaperone HslO [Erythrobacter sp. SCSIO 43205]UAB78316.1 Hsp33 family molecular chaperone HslO [Erythrobacter sp. SCSIO 43205]